MKLRPYQDGALAALYHYLEHKNGNPLVVIPTGGGKSLVIGEFIRSAVTGWPDTRIIVLTHVRELIRQNFLEMMELWPEAPAGIYSAGLGKKQLHHKITFAGIQSIGKKAFAVQHVDLVLVDEAHLIPEDADTLYRQFLADLQSINPHLRVIGFTATPFRMKTGSLHGGEKSIFDDICFEANIRELIADGYLTELVSKPGHAQIDTSGVAVRGGEFVAGQLEAAADDPDTIRAVCEEIVAHGQERAGWLVFGCGKQHCEHLAEELRSRGVTCGTIFADTPTGERDRTTAAFNRKEIRALSSMGVLTTGFNAKHVDLIAAVRPTRSLGLWIQIVGRGTRLYPGKDDCLVLDFGGNIERHGPIDAPKIKEKKKKKDGVGDAPKKACPNCEMECTASSLECAECGHVFPEPETKINATASDLALFSMPAKPLELVGVNQMSFRKHQKAGKPDSLCVTYHCGLLQFREWVCFSHEGLPRRKAVEWWQRMTGSGHVPPNTEAAMSALNIVRQPSQIAVRKSGQWQEICGYQFESKAV